MFKSGCVHRGVNGCSNVVLFDVTKSLKQGMVEGASFQFREVHETVDKVPNAKTPAKCRWSLWWALLSHILDSEGATRGRDWRGKYLPKKRPHGVRSLHLVLIFALDRQIIRVDTRWDVIASEFVKVLSRGIHKDDVWRLCVGWMRLG